ncbi:hypothetical protein BKA70DRAFT_1323887 [Coprinopsis sp. MPI-PUGE-AT-0042]|nr:hypothetical protein BKA70DRAFT_1323887 [Coprinopsis sp. MPI-PUGE-AT-0042]
METVHQRPRPRSNLVPQVSSVRRPATFFTGGEEGTKYPFVFDSASRSNPILWNHWDKALPVSAANLTMPWNAASPSLPCETTSPQRKLRIAKTRTQRIGTGSVFILDHGIRFMFVTRAKRR